MTLLQPGVDNPLLARKLIWLKHLDATELPNLLPRDIPTANPSIDKARNAVVVLADPRMMEKVERFIAEYDVETDAIRSRLPTALRVAYDETGRVTIDAKNAGLEEIVRELVIQADVDVTLFGAAPQAGQATAGRLQGRINLRIRDVTLDEAMEALFAGTGYTYRKTERGARLHYLIAPGGLGPAGSNPLLVSRRIPLKHLNASQEGNLLTLLPSTIPPEQIKVLPQQNAVVVIGTPKMAQEVADYLEAIDFPAPQVMIEAMLLELRRGDTLELGLTVGGEQGKRSGEMSGGLGLRFDTLAQVPQAFRASLEALVSQNRARVLASPRVAVLNGQEATIRVGLENLFETVTEILKGEDVPIGGVFRQSFNTIRTGITLRLKPWVGATGDITLQINPEVRDGSQITREASTIVDRSVNTLVRVPDGGMIIIGGLLQEREETLQTGVPVLSRIPLLGGLFRETTHQSSQTELIVLIQPKVMPP
ncbi:secretin and TonB N-terminal domain-containing protein [Candidatus Poribacteria bacterium]|nr:secretin and TonB N-terminal domain-containing protein [Candidatus Poribacteria bacterium]